MERRVSVNDDSDPSWKETAGLGAPEEVEVRADPGKGGGWSDVPPIYVADQVEPEQPSESDELSPIVSHGPCLYLGSSGERCRLPALAGGFCAKHHPDQERRWPGRDYRRVLLAGIALIVILWPYFQDALQLIARLIRELQAN